MRSKKFRSTLITFGMVVAAFIACQVMISTGAMTRSLKGQLVPICAYVVMAVSLNLTVGISGELSLGHAGFMSVGAFSGIVMAMWLSKGMGVANEALCLLLAILTGGAAAGIAGVVIGIPVLRLRGDYLAIVTLAFGEIIRNVINCLYISLDGQRLHIAFNNPNVAGKLLVNGPAGATGVNKMATFGMGFALTLFTLFVVLNLIDSRSGRAIMAIRDNRIAAEVVLFSDKICNDEETVRLHSHILGMKKMLEEQEGVGRKMDFMAQEMNREANTILSKSSDLEVSDIAIGLKTEIEKIREQIQNIE